MLIIPFSGVPITLLATFPAFFSCLIFTLKLQLDYFNRLTPIPSVILDNGKVINVLKLRFAIQSLTHSLEVLGWTVNQIEGSEFTLLYQNYLNFYPYCYVAA